jgi:hypothetical protein
MYDVNDVYDVYDVETRHALSLRCTFSPTFSQTSSARDGLFRRWFG